MSIAGKFVVPTPVVAALTLGVCVYTLGAISGTHINPAITIGLAAIGKISPKDAGGYLVAQFAGGGLAMVACRALAGAPAVTAVDSVAVFIAEALGAFWLAIGVAAVVHDKAPGAASGLTIGGSLLVGITMAASSGSNGVVNPAVALGIGSFSVTYLLAPLSRLSWKWRERSSGKLTEGTRETATETSHCRGEGAGLGPVRGDRHPPYGLLPLAEGLL